jgi:glutamate formiminotransferase / 5-formyltetrahydrofolate cyclo-ligase
VAERPLLLAAPNVSEGRDLPAVAAIGQAFEPARLVDVHSDADHGRSVFTLAARQGDFHRALLNGAWETLERLDLRRHRGSHPHVGALDVAPVVYVDEGDRGAACAEALTSAALIGDELAVPVFLYGQLATDPSRRERAALRGGGVGGLADRVERGELIPDFGPARVAPASGATLVTARPPLVAFNVDLESDDVELARRIAADLRESTGGRPGIRAMGLPLPGRGCAQVSFNLHDPLATPLGELVAAVAASAPVARAELVGLAPRAALADFPGDVPLLAAERHTIEDALRSIEMTAAPTEDPT